jgi:hypothetical protein
MEIRSVDDYRRALEALKRLDADDATRRELEAAVAAYAQAHNNARVRRGRPPARVTPTTPKFPED